MKTRSPLILTVTLLGCITSDVDAGFSLTWSIGNVDGEEISCGDADGAVVKIQVTDADGVSHDFQTACDAYRFDTDDWDIAAGKGKVKATLLTDEGEKVSTIPPFGFDFESGQLRNDIGERRFATDVVGGGPPAPNVTWYWRIMDESANFVQCNQVGATFLRFTVLDAEDTTHVLGTIPCRIAAAHSAHTEAPIAPGPARYTVEFLNRSQVTLDEFEFGIRIPDRPGNLEISLVTLEVSPMGVGGDAGITWEWRYRTAYFTEEVCEILGIDYAKLWIWHEAFGEWWTDNWALRAGCYAFDHPTDNGIWGDEPYSGFFLANLLPPGDYRMFLGFYSAASGDQPADVLVFYDEVDREDGRLLPNEETDYGTNIFETIVDPDRMPKTGVLRVGLEWAATEEEMLTVCESAGINEMGFALRNGELLVSELEIGANQPCRDWLDFPSLPVLDEPYELVLSGISVENEISYYTRCTGLAPEPDTTLDESQGYICRVTP